MKLRSLTLCLLLWVVAPFALLAEEWTVDNIPMVHLRDARQYVSNPDSLLSTAATDSINSILGRLEAKQGIQSVLVAVRRIAGGDPYEFGMALARKYGVGNKKTNTGLIIILSSEDRAYQILTGHGLEASLPDAICRRVENRYMVPALKEGKWDQAMLSSVVAIEKHLSGDKTLTAAEDAAEEDGEIIILLTSLIFGAGFLLFFGVLRAASRCPRCGKHKLKVISRVKIDATHERVRYVCEYCGYTKEVIERKDDHPSGGGIFMGGGGFGGGGGGFSGGSFGGGTFGGGGSGGRF